MISEVTLKSGTYGPYIEWKDSNGVINRCSTKDYRISEDIALKLVNGETCEISGKYNYGDKHGFVTGKASLSKRDGHWRIVVRNKKITLDTDIIAGAIKNGSVSFACTEGTTLEALSKSITEQLHAVKTAMRYTCAFNSFGGYRFSDAERMNAVYIYLDTYYNRVDNKLFEHFYIVDNDNVVIKAVDDENERNIYIRKSNEYENAQREARQKREAEEAEKKRQEEIDMILRTPWEEVTLGTMFDAPDEENDVYQYVTVFLAENYPDKDPNTVVLFKKKRVSYSEYEIHSVVHGRAMSSYQISAVLPRLDIQKVAKSRFFLTSSTIREASVDYDPSVEYIMDCTTYND